MYARVSTWDKSQNPEIQLDQLRRFCNAYDYEIVREYSEKKSSTDYVGREQLKQLTKDARVRKFDMILMTKADRLFRSVIAINQFVEEMNRYNVVFRSIEEGWDSGGHQGVFFMNMMASLAEFQLGNIRDNTRKAIAWRKSKGLPIGPDKLEVTRPELEELLPVYFAKHRDGEMTQAAAARELNMNRTTFNKKYKQWREE